MKILLVGSGGRESALAWKMSQSPLVESVIVSPGNPGMKRLSYKIDLMKDVSWSSYVDLQPDLVVVGPEAPLMDGITDYLESRSLRVVAPSKASALLEGSKVFCKEILIEAHIPTATYFVASTLEEVKEGLSTWKSEGVVVKVDGLAQGKGVFVASNKEEAIEAAQDFFSGTYLGYPAAQLILEERLFGEEVSCFALCDGDHFIFLGSATDYKRLNNLDQGPNTGGMGTISPSPILTAHDEEWISHHVFGKTLNVMRDRGTPFKGFLFAGLMKTESGLKVLEFNTRLGDPEAQSLLPRIKEDLIPYLLAASCGNLALLQRPELSGSCLHVVMAAKGYPGVRGESIQRGDSIHIQNLNADTLFFPAGVAGDEKELLTNGGRVCGISASGADLNLAREKAYHEIKKIQFYGAHFRTDIGAKFL